MSSKKASILLGLCLMVGAGSAFQGCNGPSTIQFGAVLPLSGERQSYGEVVRKGIEVALEEIKAEAAAKKITVELTVVDSQSDAQKAAEQLKELYDQGVLAVIGGVTTAEALAMVEVADRYNRILLSPSASTPDLTGISNRFYRVWPSDYREGMKMGEYARQKLNLETAVTLTAESQYAKGIQAVFSSSFEKNGGQVLEQIEYPAGTLELDALVDRVITLNPQCVYLADYEDVIVNLIKLLKAKSFAGKILTVSAFATQKALTDAGKDAEGVFITHSPYDPEDQENPKLQEFVKAYRAKYGETPDIYAAHGYDAMLVLYQASQLDGGDRSSSFWKGMKAITALQGATGVLQFDDQGDVQKWPRVYFVVDGKPVDHEYWVKHQKEKILQEYQRLKQEQRELVRGAAQGNG